MSFRQYLASRLLDHFCNDGAYTAGNVHIGLSSTTPNEDGTGVTEHTVGAQGYARVEMAAAAWNAATNADPSVKDNASPVTFPQEKSPSPGLKAPQLLTSYLSDRGCAGSLPK